MMQIYKKYLENKYKTLNKFTNKFMKMLFRKRKIVFCVKIYLIIFSLRICRKVIYCILCLKK